MRCLERVGSPSERCGIGLHLLLLPLAFGLLPVMIDREIQLRRGHQVLATTLLVVFVAIVIAGYMMPWSWTGFTGNKLWDWLELLVLPLAIALSPLFDGLRARPRETPYRPGAAFTRRRRLRLRSLAG